jgi:hypothetical protein
MKSLIFSCLPGEDSLLEISAGIEISEEAVEEMVAGGILRSLNLNG